MPQLCGVELGDCARACSGHNQNTVSEPGAQAGRWELGAKMEDCGWDEEVKKQGHEGGLEAVWVSGTHLLLAAENGSDAGDGSIGLTPIFSLIVPKVAA